MRWARATTTDSPDCAGSGDPVKIFHAHGWLACQISRVCLTQSVNEWLVMAVIGGGDDGDDDDDDDEVLSSCGRNFRGAGVH